MNKKNHSLKNTKAENRADTAFSLQSQRESPMSTHSSCSALSKTSITSNSKLPTSQPFYGQFAISFLFFTVKTSLSLWLELPPTIRDQLSTVKTEQRRKCSTSRLWVDSRKWKENRDTWVSGPRCLWRTSRCGWMGLCVRMTVGRRVTWSPTRWSTRSTWGGAIVSTSPTTTSSFDCFNIMHIKPKKPPYLFSP